MQVVVVTKNASGIVGVFLRMIPLGFLCFTSGGVKAEALFSWSQIVAGDNLSVRAVVSPSEDCPEIEVHGKKFVMGVRALPESGRFDDKVCEKLIPLSPGIGVVRMGEKLLPGLLTTVEKVAVLGDTGCRLSRFAKQNCRSPDAWPLRSVLREIAERNPDLVVHVGDYLYREVECSDVAKCGEKVHGDNASTWIADWLSPMQEVSGKLLFMFVRGNHESCKRAYRGWFRYLDAWPFVSESGVCEEITNSWSFDAKKLGMGDVNLYVYDSASGEEALSLSLDIEKLRKKFLENLPETLSNRMWLLTHQPLWVHSKRYGLYYEGNLPLVLAIGEDVLRSFEAVISGHVHIAQILRVRGKAERSNLALTQIISGNGGTSLDKSALSSDVWSFSLSDFMIDKIQTFESFGFCIISNGTGVLSRVKDSSVPHESSELSRATFHNLKGRASRAFDITRSLVDAKGKLLKRPVVSDDVKEK